MAKFGERKQGGSSVTASELSQMGVCERLVVFEHRHGKRWSRERKQAVRRGLLAHQQFHRNRFLCRDRIGCRNEIASTIRTAVLRAARGVSKLFVRWTKRWFRALEWRDGC